MKKVILVLFLVSILFGMLFNSSVVLAEDENDSVESPNSGSDDRLSAADDSEDNSNSDSAADSNSDDVLEANDDSEDEVETEVEAEDEESFSRIRERIRDRDNVRREFSREVRDEEGNRVIIERKVEIKDGEVKIKIKKTIIFADGTRRVIEMEMERNAEGVSREIKIEGENISLDSGLEINDLFEGNESELEAFLSNGNKTRIKVLPEQARVIILERLKTRNISNMTLEEVRYKNIPRVVYNIETNQKGRFLGVFKLAMKSETQIDPETGEVLDVNRPWWAFLVSVPEEEAAEENSLITYVEAVEIAQTSNCTQQGNLTDEYWYNNDTRTWWIDLDLEMDGCNPTCVIDEEQRTAEINYMCTGLA